MAIQWHTYVRECLPVIFTAPWLQKWQNYFFWLDCAPVLSMCLLNAPGRREKWNNRVFRFLTYLLCFLLYLSADVSLPRGTSRAAGHQYAGTLGSQVCWGWGHHHSSQDIGGQIPWCVGGGSSARMALHFYYLLIGTNNITAVAYWKQLHYFRRMRLSFPSWMTWLHCVLYFTLSSLSEEC